MEFCFREDFQPARHETHSAKLLFHSESREVSLRRGVQVPAGQQVLLASFICGLFHLAFFFSPARTESCVSDFFYKVVCVVTLLKKQKTVLLQSIVSYWDREASDL